MDEEIKSIGKKKKKKKKKPNMKFGGCTSWSKENRSEMDL